MSASAGNNFPSDITEAILSLLPAKSLGRFKLVSKKWNSLISDPRFIKTHLHLNNHRHQTKLMLLTNTDSLCSLDISQLFQRLNVDDISVPGKELSFGIEWEEMFGSCNGLVLARDKKDVIYLMNPMTQELWRIADPPFDGDIDVRYGFGYDASTDDYKIISISFWDLGDEHDPSYDMHVSVYSLRNNSWREFPNSSYDQRAFHLIYGASINQNLNFHWSTTTPTIVAFSLANEEFSEIKLPDSVVKAGSYYLLDIGGKLGVMVGIRGCFELWVMEESWTRACSFRLEKRMAPVNPMCLVKGSNRIIVLDDDYSGEIVVYNVDERKCRNLRIVADPSGFAIGGTYVETLESPGRIITPP